MTSFSICICQLDRIDQIIHREVQQCYPRYWSEDHITFSWLRRLIAEWPLIKLDPHPTVSVQWDAYKMSGKLEQENGDVCFLIDINFDNKNSLQGVGFLEAKRIYDSGQFDALKWAQLRLLSGNSSNHQLLLYDHTPLATQYSLDVCLPRDFCPCCEECTIYCCEPSDASAAIVLPTIHAIAYEEKGRKLEGISHRLSEQIVLRYFRGLDLNFDADLVKRVLAGAAGGSKFLAVATIRVGIGEGLPSPVDPQERKPIRPDEESGYRPLESDGRRDG
ncbi:hypothetical protein [Xanthomonas arboricola]|uniref:hypothetical protein n=1 Tax=Xanthomonas arboricola TaxID=56448 RepID=UPI003EBEE160